MEIAVISGKGGTGKSSITAAFATLGKKVLLADCDVDAANMHLIMNPSVEESTVYVSGEKAVINPLLCAVCGLCYDYCRFDAISFSDGKYHIDDVACDGCRLCTRICPEGAISMVKNDKSRMYSGSFRNGKMVFGLLEPGEENSGKLVAMIREKCRKVSEKNNLDTTIIDAPPGIGCAVISSITGTDRVFIVTEPSLSGFSDLKRVLQLIESFGIKRSVIINKYDLCLPVSKEIENFCLKEGIEISCKLPFEPEVVNAMINCQSITEWRPECEVSKILKEIWNKLQQENLIDCKD
ncbi:MAG: ATP-binding protein [Bacteroidales bacterium]|nr:ATP-binding protein [Bacteroidales bacterium]MDD2425513.1 ATP-binding protein [Bacteroidales bacterium]MDD3989403.1 ATP-binding protein [Bacteroidales bacterium]MDD4639047.1 ATP-binding protein [Bacteroidales bacterium]